MADSLLHPLLFLAGGTFSSLTVAFTGSLSIESGSVPRNLQMNCCLPRDLPPPTISIGCWATRASLLYPYQTGTSLPLLCFTWVTSILTLKPLGEFPKHIWHTVEIQVDLSAVLPFVSTKPLLTRPHSYLKTHDQAQEIMNVSPAEVKPTSSPSNLLNCLQMS